MTPGPVPLPVPDCVDSLVGSDLAAGAVEFEAESWSLSVEHKFCKRQDKQEVKRQDVIYGEQRSGVRPPRRVCAHPCLSVVSLP